MHKLTLLTLCTFLCSLFSLRAQDTTAVEEEGKLSISGYIDNYYFKNLYNPLSGKNAPNGVERIFDQKEGQFQIGLVQTKFIYTTKRSELVADLVFGPNADLGNFGNYTSLLGEGITSTAFAIKQAYWTYKLTDKLSFTAGQFGTHIGYEVIDAPVNFNYSLSYLFGNGPFYHLGVKANYAFSDRVGLMAGIVNNWDSNFDNNRFKTAIAQLFIAPVENWNVYLNFIGGNEQEQIPTNSSDSVKAKTMLFDLTTGYQITDKFYVGLNGAYGFKTKQEARTAANPNRTEPKPWGGLAFYTNYAITDFFGIGARAEYFDNTQNIQYLANTIRVPEGDEYTLGTDVYSFTLTGNITLANGHLLLKPEVRFDKFKEFEGEEFKGFQQLEDSKGNFTNTSQTTIGLATIYKF